MLMVQAMLCFKDGLFFLSPAPVGPLSTQGTQREFLFLVRFVDQPSLKLWQGKDDESDQPSVPFRTYGLIQIQLNG